MMTCPRPIYSHADLIWPDGPCKKQNFSNLSAFLTIKTQGRILAIVEIDEDYLLTGTAAQTWRRTWRARCCRTTGPTSPSSSYPAPSTAQTHPDNNLPHPHLGTCTVAVIPGLVSSLKGTVASDGFLIISLHPRYRIRILHFFYLCRTLASFSVFGECAKISQLLMRTLQGQYIYHVMRHLISEPQENKMQLKFLACLTEKFHCAYSPYALNELNLTITH
jgi:hypothetical protein